MAEKEKNKKESLYDDVNPITASIAGVMDLKREYSKIFSDMNETMKNVREGAMMASKTFGVGLKSYTEITQEIAKALPEMARLGYSANEIGAMQDKFTKNITTNVVLSSEALKGIGILDKLGADGETIAVNFRRSARSLKTMVDDLSSVTTTAANYGVNTSVILEAVRKTMETADQYRFEKGIEGISRMAAQAASMGVSFNSIKSLSDSIMDPEGAINMVNKLQLLGITQSSLLDPFKVMYMAQSDMEGLTDEIGRALSTMGSFNEETGQMEISPAARMSFKDIANTLHISEKEINSIISQQGKLNAMENKGVFDSLNVTDEQKTLISTLAEFNKEKGGFEIKLGDGTTKMVEDLKHSEIEILSKEPEGLKDAANQQMDYVESIKNDVKAIRLAIQSEGIGTKPQMDAEAYQKTFFDNLSKSSIEAIKSLNIKKEFNDLFESTIKTVSEISKVMATGKGGDKTVANFDKLSKESDDAIERISEKLVNSLPRSVSGFVDHLNAGLNNDNMFKEFGINVGKMIDKFYSNIKEPFTIDKSKHVVTEKQTDEVQKTKNSIDAGKAKKEATNTLPEFELKVEDFIIKPLPQDTVTVVGGTNIPKEMDINNLTNNVNNTTFTNNTTSSVMPIQGNLLNIDSLVDAIKRKEPAKQEISVNFKPLVLKLEGNGQSIDLAMENIDVRNKLIKIVSDAMEDEYRLLGSSGIKI